MWTYGTKYPKSADGMAMAQMTYFLFLQLSRLTILPRQELSVLGVEDSGLRDLKESVHTHRTLVMAARTRNALAS